MYTLDFSERLTLCINKIGGITKTSAIIGVANMTLGRWKDGTSDPKLSNVVAFAKAANVSIDWLVLGIDNDGSPVNLTPLDPDADATNPAYIYLPAYNIQNNMSATELCSKTPEPTKHIAFRRQWIASRGLDSAHIVALFGTGDSMSPTIPPASVIIIDCHRNQAADGKVYVISIDNRLYVKRVQWLIGGGLRLISDNKLYDPLDITKDDMNASNVQICGQVIHASYDLPD